MGTKVDTKTYLPGYYSMRDLNEDSSSSSWPHCYGDKIVPNGQYYNGFMPRTTAMDGYPSYGKDALKQKMLEHEAVFKNQVYELHRLYRIQRDMMEEFRRKELHGIRASMEPSSSSSLRGPQYMASFPLLNHDKTSISGVEFANSPMSCTKRNSTQPGQFPFPNRSCAKDSEPLDSRPMKVRKKLFDLELPADEYVDTEEGKRSPEPKMSHAPSAPNGNIKGGPENQKLSTDCRVDVSTSGSCLRNPIWLADLNEPIDSEETTAPSSTEFLGHSSKNHPAKSNAGFLGVKSKTVHYRDGFLVNSSIESNVNERGKLSHIYEAGSSRSNLDSVTPGLQKDNSHPMQSMLNPHNHPTRCCRQDLWREGNHHQLESSNNRFLGPHIASHTSDPFASSSYFSGTWARAVSSWAKPTKSFSQKLTALDSCSNPAAAMDRGLQISAENGGKWHVGDGFLLGGDQPPRNGFYHGSASGYKVQSPSTGFDYSRGDNLASDRVTNHGLFGHIPKGSSSFADSKPAIDINLNESSSNEVVIMQEGKPTEHLSTLPWLKNKPANANHASSTQLGCKTDTVRDLNEPFTPKLPSASSETKNVKKILGFPIFETGDKKSEHSSHVSISASFSCPPNGNGFVQERKNIVIDINLECEPEEEETIEKEKHARSASVRDFIDLNSCVTDCEDTLAPSYESKTADGKKILDIDLESPLLPEKEDGNTPSNDEALRTAAEVILAISSSSPKTRVDDDSIINLLETSLAESESESFMWFVISVASCPNEVKRADLSEEMDEFEATTLQIPEMKEEDYMPTPFIPEVQTAEDNTLTRPRRGQSRRGRQRRDFQRDILPGLTSLARHEVTEDIQTFGGLMRATGHQWVSRLARRNGGGRGRRRGVVENVTTAPPSPVCTPLIQQLSGLEDRSLTGWGKTPRRPRRQRCPAGNPPAVVLT